MTVSLCMQLSGFVTPESDNDEHYNDKLLRERDKIAEQLRRRLEGSFYEDGLLLDLLTI